ncbi:MAG TPA: low molecular weight protein-tyrosine-phosphatase [Polyangiales bacterium]
MTASNDRISVCFVCLGNICRSPTAEGVMKQLVEEAGLAQRFFIDSAGTAAYHSGQPADARSGQAALRRGVQLTSRARHFAASDFDAFDYVVAMDRKNFADLSRLAAHERHRDKLSLLRSFDALASGLDVPDPYYGDNFDEVFDICLAGCTGLLTHVVTRHGLPR